MNLRLLIQSLKIDNCDYKSIPDIDITGLHFHSKKIESKNLFIAISGYQSDGHHYIYDAIQAGASAIIGEKEITGIPVPYFKVEDSRLALAHLVRSFYGDPASKHTLVGITGTNGKTTTSYMLRHILEQSGIRCSIIGTISHIINGKEIVSENTTPDALTLQQLIYKSKDPVIILEVSSHGLQQRRVAGLSFDCALFTNLSHDHLNYHRNINEYFETKASLFTQLKPEGEAIVSSYSEWGRRLIDLLITQQKKVHSIGDNDTDDMNLTNVYLDNPSVFELSEGAKMYTVSLHLYGLHNVWNASLAFAAARRMGVNENQIIHSLQSFPGTPGRFETYQHPVGATFVVDYAHTPDAVFHCLQTMKQAGAKRIIHIFGFRGKGDPSKRKEMVAISSQSGDMFILTLDDLNGLSIDEMKLELQHLNELNGKGNGKVIEDRTLAIRYAWENVQKDDWVLITGKGPEKYDQSFVLPTDSDKNTIEWCKNHNHFKITNKSNL
jgi:UDP-N-acetylmuramoyl-L-alanyl-D-glutamate--2,6-diaminopimelate ligase